MDAAYVFRVRVRLDPSDPGVSLDPREFETILRLDADPPGDGDWRFFRDNLWRGEVNDERHLRRTAEAVLDVPVTSVSFRELETDGAYLDALRAAIADELDEYNADGVDEVLHKYLGSSIRVRDA
ncbi:LWR-salt protein [Haloferacaceae archaeon DSL9]